VNKPSAASIDFFEAPTEKRSIPDEIADDQDPANPTHASGFVRRSEHEEMLRAENRACETLPAPPEEPKP
jgi:hypothetical protein